MTDRIILNAQGKHLIVEDTRTDAQREADWREATARALERMADLDDGIGMHIRAEQHRQRAINTRNATEVA